MLSEKEANEMLKILKKEYPNVHYYLNYKTPLELLVCAILSAQTRDEVVNKATPELFKKFDTAHTFSKATPDQLNEYIKSITFFQAKSKNIIEACKVIVEKYDGNVPRTMGDLLSLPGIGRKTANTILINAYGIVEGIPVDTWVIKLSTRMGFTKNKNPDKIENDLMNLFKKEYWKDLAYLFKTHGKAICKSTVPICSKCSVSKLCPKIGVEKYL
ncbi:MAG: endonuclease III [Candidatus Micrarchaeia archaeon]